MAFAGEIKLFAYPRDATGWIVCDGSAYTTAAHPNLFARIGYTFGGAGAIFKVPDLRGRIPRGTSPIVSLNTAQGVESVALTTSAIPAHDTMTLPYTGVGVDSDPTDKYPITGRNDYTALTGHSDYLSPLAVSAVGQGQAHENMPPFLALSYRIFEGPDDPTATQLLGELRVTTFGFAMKNFASCRGQLLSIAANAALFSLLGTTFGGNGVTNFALPSLAGRVPVGAGTGPLLTPRAIGDQGGVERVALTTAELPAHAPRIPGSETLADNNERGVDLGSYAIARADIYAPDTVPLVDGGDIVNAAGGSAHENMPPFVVCDYQVALNGIYPT
jgi:microcystin-dependent protein